MANGVLIWEYTDENGAEYAWQFCMRLRSLMAIEADGFELRREAITDPALARSVLTNSIDAGEPADLGMLPEATLLDAANSLLVLSFPVGVPDEGDPS